MHYSHFVETMETIRITLGFNRSEMARCLGMNENQYCTHLTGSVIPARYTMSILLVRARKLLFR